MMMDRNMSLEMYAAPMLKECAAMDMMDNDDELGASSCSEEEE